MPQDSPHPIRVIVAMDFSDAQIERLRAVSPQLQIERHHPDVPDSAWAEAEVLYTIRHYPGSDQAPHLRWIQLHFAGSERAQEQAIIRAQDIVLTTASGIHAEPMAQFTLMAMLAFHYQLPRMVANQAEKHWPAEPHTLFRPPPLSSRTIGVVGYGSIGREIARLAAAMGMTVLAAKRDLTTTAPREDAYQREGTGDPTGDIPERIYPHTAIATMARDCDYLAITTPLTPETHHLIGASVFNAMKPESVLVNVARGAVVDEAALIEALQADKLRGAALDVFETEPLPASSPLWDMPNVIISPHVSGNSEDYNEKAAALFGENLRRYVEKRALLNVLDRRRGY
jgi:phosphoglycerate dehydrogenase-like enzyme